MFDKKMSIYKEEELGELVDFILENYPRQKLFLLHGDLGSGKTTFVKAFLKKLSYKGMVQSPSYGIVNEYLVKIDREEQKVFHIDLYRIVDVNELVELGFEEYLLQNAWVFIEWPDIGSAYYPEEHVNIHISVNNENGRIFSLKANRKH